MMDISTPVNYVRDLDCKFMVYKFGQTEDFTKRLSSLRTSCPRMTVERLIYIENHIEFESKVKQCFKENGHLKFQNHEFVEIPLEYVNKVVNTYLDEYEYEYDEIPTNILERINKQYLACVSDRDVKLVDLIFYHMEKTPDFRIDYRKFCQWVEINNFGKELTGKEHYILYDFKTTFLYRLHTSGMSTSDISTFAHHKNTSTTENHLKNCKLIYTEKFVPLKEEK